MKPVENTIVPNSSLSKPELTLGNCECLPLFGARNIETHGVSYVPSRADTFLVLSDIVNTVL